MMFWQWCSRFIWCIRNFAYCVVKRPCVTGIMYWREYENYQYIMLQDDENKKNILKNL